MAIGVYGTFAQIGTVAPEGLPWEIAAAPVLPGFFAALFLGLGNGAHGFPNHEDLAPYLIAFAMWWVVIDQARAWWRRRRASGRRTPSAQTPTAG